jgi:UPF0755 protein
VVDILDEMGDREDMDYMTSAHPRPPHPPRRHLPRWAGLLIVVGVLAGALAALILGIGFIVHKVGGGSSANADYTGNGSGRVVVQVLPGTAVQIGDTLVKDGVVKTVGAFTDAANADPRSRSIQPGFYALHHQMSAAAAITLLLDPSARAEARVTIPEGIATRRMLKVVSQATGIKLADLQAAAKQPQALGLPSWITISPEGYPEGFLFPATYQVPPNAKAMDVLKMFAARFNQEVKSINLVQGAAALGKTPNQIVTIASIIEGEAVGDSDRGKIARVIYNRLQDTGQFPTLGMDSTTRYALGGYLGPLKQSQLATDSPYNTRVKPGLPPGPIDNPGEAALVAALHPTAGPWLYFVTLPKEHVTKFAVTSQEFANLENQLHAEGG